MLTLTKDYMRVTHTAAGPALPLVGHRTTAWGKQGRGQAGGRRMAPCMVSFFFFKQVLQKYQRLSLRKNWFSSTGGEQASFPTERSCYVVLEKGFCLGLWPLLRDSVQIGINSSKNKDVPERGPGLHLPSETITLGGTERSGPTWIKAPHLKGDRNLYFSKVPQANLVWARFKHRGSYPAL